MALYIASLNSGSNGNCYYVGNENEAVLIDLGISCREAEIRMKKIGLSMKKVKAIFVSHEHTDHNKGVSTFAHKYSLPVYITPETSKTGTRLIKQLLRPFIADQHIEIGDLQIVAFTKHHDAIDPHSFIIRNKEITVGVITDIGIVCNQVQHYFKQCNAAFLESNYDELMLQNGRYPQILKDRITGGKGHISNKESLELFINHRSPNLSHLLLAHLSKENNTPELVQQLFAPHAGNTLISVASRYEASEVYKIEHATASIETPQKFNRKTNQFSLF